ncbi:MAG: flagellar protein FliS [Candidatus Brocadiia bacterium]|jgi:flagellin-specific chaperone FliS
MPVGLQAKKQYLEDQISGLSPVQLLIRLYDVAVVSCTRKDQRRLNQALVQLIGSLNFEYGEISLGSYRLYNYCLRQARMGRFEEVQAILAGLRDAWVRAERKMRTEAAIPNGRIERSVR